MGGLSIVVVAMLIVVTVVLGPGAISVQDGGTIEVKKALSPTTDRGTFNLLIDDTNYATVGNGGSTGAKTVTTSKHTVSETAGSGTNLTHYSTKYSCRINDSDGPSGSGTSFEVKVTAGDKVVCTFTNTRCKDVHLKDATLSKNIVVAVRSKGGHVGDKGTLEMKNNTGQCFIVHLKAGTTFNNKNERNQSLVGSKVTPQQGNPPFETVTIKGIKHYKIPLQEHGTVILKGIWTFCIDGKRGSPVAGPPPDKFDIGPNICEFPHPAAENLCKLIKIIDEKNLHGSQDGQDSVWFYTDARKSTKQEVIDLIKASGGNPDKPPENFPHFKNPNKETDETAVVVPQEVSYGNAPTVDKTLNLEKGDVKEETLEFEGPNKVFTYEVKVPKDAELSVKVMDLGIEGDTWGAEIYEAEILKALTRGDVFEKYSEPAVAKITTGKAFVRISYITGLDIWKAAMKVQFSVK